MTSNSIATLTKDTNYSCHKKTVEFVSQSSQQNYLAKTDLDDSVFLCENPIFMSVWVVVMSVQVVVIPLGITTTWMDITTTQTDIKTGFSWRNMEPSKSVLAR